jgi:hypothetical protein
LVLIVPRLGAVFDIALVPIRLCLGVYLALALPWCLFWLLALPWCLFGFGAALVLCGFGAALVLVSALTWCEAHSALVLVSPCPGAELVLSWC